MIVTHGKDLMSRLLTLAAAGALGAVLVGSQSANGSGSVSPQALYEALCTSKPFESLMPAGFSTSTATRCFRPGSNTTASRHNGIGEVVDAIRGPDGSDEFAIGVFPTAPDAAGDFAEAVAP